MLQKNTSVFLLCFVLIVIIACSGCDSAAKKLKIGDTAPEFSGTDLSGQPLSLAGYHGQPVILRFWSTDCKFCRADTPIFNQYFEKYKSKGLRVVYINRHSDEATVRQFVSELEIGFPVLIDKDGSISAKYNIKVEPQTIILSPDHKIVAAILGGVSEAEMKNILDGYFNKNNEKKS